MRIFDFGKHKGLDVSEIPESYLRWAVANIRTLTVWQKSTIRGELSRRKARGNYEHREPPRSSSNSPVDCSSIIRRWHHELTLRWHPDRGGNNEIMAAINEAADRLKAMLEI